MNSIFAALLFVFTILFNSIELSAQPGPYSGSQGRYSPYSYLPPTPGFTGDSHALMSPQRSDDTIQYPGTSGHSSQSGLSGQSGFPRTPGGSSQSGQSGFPRTPGGSSQSGQSGFPRTPGGSSQSGYSSQSGQSGFPRTPGGSSQSGYSSKSRSSEYSRNRKRLRNLNISPSTHQRTPEHYPMSGGYYNPPQTYSLPRLHRPQSPTSSSGSS